MNNELIPTNGLWYRIKNFFKNLFFKEKESSVKYIKSFENSTKNNTITFNDNLKEKFERENEKKVLAEKLLLGEIESSELKETEVDEMTEYFTKDIQNIDSELSRIKRHIIAMQQELKQ
mgnify:CR=1 FL=1